MIIYHYDRYIYTPHNAELSAKFMDLTKGVLLTQKQYNENKDNEHIDIQMQKYRFKNAYKNYNEHDMEAIGDYLFSEVTSDLYYRGLHYYNRVVKSLLNALIKNNQFEVTLDYYINKHRFAGEQFRRKLSDLYCKISYKKRYDICRWFCYYMYDDYKSIVIDDDLFHYINKALTLNNEDSFKNICLNAAAYYFIIIRKDMFRLWDFNDYKRRFNTLKHILKSNRTQHFLTNEEYKKHFNQLAKTANYKTTNVYDIDDAIAYGGFNEEEIEILNAIKFAKQL